MAFETQTVAFGTAIKKPPFFWSYSKLKNYRSCPKRHFHYDVSKEVREPPSPQLEFGDQVHHAMHRRLDQGKPLPTMMQDYEQLVQTFLGVAQRNNGKILVEQKFGIRRDFTPCEYFGDKLIWYRSIADAVIIMQDTALNWDWKTGAPPYTKGQKDDPIQILTAAACIMYHYPNVQAVRSELIWMEYGTKTRCDIQRHELPAMWASIDAEVRELEEAYATMTFPPKKNGLCKEYCAVETCKFHPDFEG